MTYSEQNRENKFVYDEYKKYDLSVPIMHWQLRDLICVDEEENIYYQNNNVLKSFNPETHVKKDILNLESNPVSISYHKKVIAVGGSTGWVTIVTPHQINTLRAEDCIINNVYITSINGKMLLFTCSNNNQIKIFDLETNHLIDVINHECPINSCKVSCDGRMMISSCDSNYIIKYHYESGSFKKYENSYTEKDSAFSVSWSRNSMKYAAGTQDGFCIVWDIRMDNKLYRIPSSQPKTIKGAIRTVNFSQCHLFDTILFTEHTNYFHIVDTRNNDHFESCYKNRQVKRLNESEEINISGAAFGKYSENIYISTEDSLYKYKSVAEIFKTSKDCDIA